MNIVAHNLAAMNASRQFNINSKQKAKDSEQLSSGYRINRAGDDAAGLAISEKMRQMVKGLDRAGDNVQEAISFVQTADGALAEAADMAQRINELAIQAANGTQSESDRRAIDNEVQQLKTEMSRIFETTTFNNKKIWDGEGRVGSVEDVTIEEPVINNISSSFSTNVTNENKLLIPSSSPVIVADKSGYKVTWSGWKADGSVGAKYESKKILWEDVGGIAGVHNFVLKDNLPDTLSASEKAVFETIDMSCSFKVNAQAGMTEAIDSLNKIYLEYNTPNTISVDYGGTGISFTATMPYKYFLKYGRDFNNIDTTFIVSAATDNVKIPTYDSPDTTMAFKLTTKNGVSLTATPGSGSYACSSHGTAGEDVWWEKRYDKYGNRIEDGGLGDNVSDSSLSKMYASISEGNPNVIDDKGNNTTKYSYTFSVNEGSTPVGNIIMSFSNASINLSNDDANDPQKVNEAIDKMRKSLASKVGQITKFDINAGATPLATSSYNDGASSETLLAVYQIDQLVYDPHDVSVQSGAETGNTTILQYPDLNINALGIEYLRMHPQEMALLAIDDIGKAIAIINKSRVLFGAYQNRLESTYNINAYTMENTQASESAIRDTDMAKAMLAFTKDNIVSQASQSMLTQANMSAEDVLSLLQ